MSGLMTLDRRTLQRAFSEIEDIGQKLPEAALADLAKEVTRRVADNLRHVAPPDSRPSGDEIDALCLALLSRDSSDAVTLIETAQRRGASHGMLCEHYLADASRRLGDWWTDDRVSFYQVTLAAGRIYAILRILRLQSLPPMPDMAHSAIFANVPGDDHTLGITIAADLARDRGWDIELLIGRSHDELVGQLELRDPPVIGLSAGSRRSLPALIKLVVAIRLTKPASRLFVCGQIAALDLDLVGVAGVDAMVPDLDAALAFMDRSVRPCEERVHA